MTKTGTFMEKSLYEHRLIFMLLCILTYLNSLALQEIHSVIWAEN